MQELADALERLVLADQLYAEAAQAFVVTLRSTFASDRPDLSDDAMLEAFTSRLVSEAPITPDELAALGRLRNAIEFSMGLIEDDDPDDV